MLGAIKYYTSLFFMYAKLSLLKQLEYPSHLISWVILIPIQYFAGIWMLKILVDKFHPIAGWTFPELCFIYGLGLLSHGVTMILFIQTWYIEEMVIYGDFDRLMLRPANVFFQTVLSYINLIGVIDLIPGAIIFFHACSLVHFAWTLENLIKMVFIVLGGTLIRAAVYIIIGSIAFWTKRSFQLVMVGLTFLERSTMYPVNIYPYLLQCVLTFVIPVAFISFYPSYELLGVNHNLNFPINATLGVLLIGSFLCFIAYLVFYSGLKRYESSGS